MGRGDDDRRTPLGAFVDRVRGRAASGRPRHDTDPLTGLPGRAALERVVDHALGRLRPERPADDDADDVIGVGVLLCDLDGFETVNDALGPAAGDQLLVETARRIRGCVRPGDVVIRSSGDEFAIVIADVDDEVVRRIADDIVREVARPVELGTRAIDPSISVGTTLGRAGDSADDLVRDAGLALRRAKDLGRSRVCRFDTTLRIKVADRLLVEHGLRTALEQRTVVCAYQPTIELSSGRVIGFEALARWPHPKAGMIMPDRFVPVAEATGLVDLLFDVVLERALADQSRWERRLGYRMPVAVNVSARQLGGDQLVRSVEAALHHASVPADALWLEVTETAAVDTAARRSLQRLHDLGVKLAIDDFGAGNSSMARLSLLPWDALKIDGAFVAPLGTDPLAEHLVRAMVALAHSLGVSTVAEGVETTTQLDHLVSLGCDAVQGYLFTHPLPPERAILDVQPSGVWGRPPADHVAVAGSTEG